MRDLHAHAQRGLLIERSSLGDGQTAGEIVEAMARRQVEYYVIRPSQSPDELFHRSVSTFLLEWANAKRVSPHTVHIVSESWTGHELKEVLGRCAVPQAFLLADSRHGRHLPPAWHSQGRAHGRGGVFYGGPASKAPTAIDEEAYVVGASSARRGYGGLVLVGFLSC